MKQTRAKNEALERVFERADAAGLLTGVERLEAIREYADALIAVPGRVSTADRTPAGVAQQIEDCFSALTCSDIEWSGAQVADVGSGQGLPGLVLRLMRPEIARMLLVDRSRRKSAMLRQLAIELDADVEVVNGSAPAVFADQTVSKADLVLMRALGPPASSTQVALDCLEPSGTGILWLGRRDTGRIGQIAATAGDNGREIVIHRAEMLESRGWLAIIRGQTSAKAPNRG